MKYAVMATTKKGEFFTEVWAADALSAASKAHDDLNECGDFTVYPAYGDRASAALGAFTL